jgi:hypothetical protein
VRKKLRVALLSGLAIGVAEGLRFHLILLDALAERLERSRGIRLRGLAGGVKAISGPSTSTKF